MNLLTSAGLALFANAQSTQSTVNITKFVFADVQGLTEGPIDPSMTTPEAPQLVHTEPVSQSSYINTNMVVYSAIVPSEQPSFDYNFVGLVTDDDVLIGGAYVSRRSKGVGSTIVRNFAIEYSNVRTLTVAPSPVESWQLDHMLLFRGAEDSKITLANDVFGTVFFDSGLLVAQDGPLHSVSIGSGYVKGVRVQVSSPSTGMDFGPFPTSIFVDVSLKRTINGFSPETRLVASQSFIDDFIDAEGNNHFVSKIADIASDGTVTDLRKVLPAGSLFDNSVQPDGTYALLRAQGTTKEDVGLGNLPNAISDSVVGTASDIVASEKAVGTAYSKAEEALTKANTLTASDVGASEISHDHDSAYYTKPQVDSKLADLVDSAPGTLNTLNELAAALGDDPNFATTVTTSIANKADATYVAQTFGRKSELVNGVLRVPSPGGAQKGTTTTLVTGAIAIVLPVSWTNTMMSFLVDVYDHAVHKSTTFRISGYNYATLSDWSAFSAYAISSDSNVNMHYTVSFGHNGTNCVVYIEKEDGSAWTYPQVVVRDFAGGFQGNTAANWESGWNIELGATVENATYSVTVATEVSVAAASVSNNVLTVPYPDGGRWASGNSSEPGTIAIVLPQSWTSTMMSFVLDIFNHAESKSDSLYITGYNRFEPDGWVNGSVSSTSNSEYTVAFGHTGTKCAIYISRLGGSAWAFPRFVVRDFTSHHLNSTSDKWSGGWQILPNQTAQNVTLQLEALSKANRLIAQNNRKVKPSATAAHKQIAAFFVTLEGLTGETANSTDYQDLLVLDTWGDATGGAVNALAFDKRGTKAIRHYRGAFNDSSTWGTPDILAYQSWVADNYLQLNAVVPIHRTYFVANSGDDSNTGLSESDPLLTLGEAVKRTSIGAAVTIKLKPNEIHYVTDVAAEGNVAIDGRFVLVVPYTIGAGTEPTVALRGASLALLTQPEFFRSVAYGFGCSTRGVLNLRNCHVDTGSLSAGQTERYPRFGGLFSRAGGSGEAGTIDFSMSYGTIYLRDHCLSSHYNEVHYTLRDVTIDHVGGATALSDGGVTFHIAHHDVTISDSSKSAADLYPGVRSDGLNVLTNTELGSAIVPSSNVLESAYASHILHPSDATGGVVGTATGAIAVRLPTLHSESTIAFNLTVSHLQGTDTLTIGGYTGTSTWTAASASSTHNHKYTISYGNDGVRDVVYIERLGGIDWASPCVSVTDALVGGNSFSGAVWQKNWQVLFNQAPQNVQQIVTLNESYLDKNVGGTVEGDVTVNGSVNVNAGDGVAAVSVASGDGSLDVLSDHDYFGAGKSASVLRVVDDSGSAGAVDGGLIVEGYTSSDDVSRELLRVRDSEFAFRGNPVYHAGYHGVGSGLDAELLQGKPITKFENSRLLSGVVHIAHPADGMNQFIGDSSASISITLPNLARTTTVSFDVRLSNLSPTAVGGTQSHCVLTIGGHVSSDGVWYHTSASSTVGDYMIEYGNNGGNPVVRITRLDVSSSHDTTVVITNVVLSFGSVSIDPWDSGWSIAFQAPALTTVDATVSSTAGSSLPDGLDHYVNYKRENNVISVVNPVGGSAFATGAIPGAIEIIFPAVASATMYSLEVSIYNYKGNGKSATTLFLGGYAYTNTTWINVSAISIGDKYKVSFACNTANSLPRIYIERTDGTDWQYPQVTITKLVCSHTLNPDEEHVYKEGWNVQLGTTPTDVLLVVNDSHASLDAGTLANFGPSTTATASTVVVRDTNGDAIVRTLRASLANQTSDVASGAALAFRNDTSDNGIRFAGKSGIRKFLGLNGVRTASSASDAFPAITEFESSAVSVYDGYGNMDNPSLPERSYWVGMAAKGQNKAGLIMAANWNTDAATEVRGRVNVRTKDDTADDWTDWKELAWYNDIETEVSRSAPVGLEGQISYITSDGQRDRETGWLVTDGNFPTTAAELTQALGSSVTQQEIFDTWGRFSHNSTENQPAYASEITQWSYDAGTGTISSTINSTTHIGFYSTKKYDSYLAETKLTSASADDDRLGFVIAFHVDGAGREHTLTALRNNDSVTTWNIVYNYLRSDAVIIANGSSFITKGGLWNSYVSGTRIKVKRTGDIIEAWSTQNNSSTFVEAAKLTVDLSSNTLLHKFRGPQSYGYSCQSQDQARFSELTFSSADTSSNVYDVSTGDVYVPDGNGGFVLDNARTFVGDIGIGRILRDKTSQRLMYINNDGIVVQLSDISSVSSGYDLLHMGNYGTTDKTHNAVETRGVGSTVYGGLAGTRVGVWQYSSANPGYGTAYEEGPTDKYVIDVSGGLFDATPDFEVRPDSAFVNGKAVLTDNNTLVTSKYGFARSLHGGYTNPPNGNTWAGGIWSIGSAFSGTSNGDTFDATSMYGLAWVRSDHPLYNSYIGEGLYVIVQGTVVGGIGVAGAWTSGVLSQK